MDHITKIRDVEGQPGGLDAAQGKGSSLGVIQEVIPVEEKCAKCGGVKFVGEPCIPCWNREAAEDMEPKTTAPPPEVRVAEDPRVCCVAAPCGSPCKVSYDGSVEGHFSNHRDYSTGWICPKCGNVYGPNTMECWGCNQPLKVTCCT